MSRVDQIEILSETYGCKMVIRRITIDIEEIKKEN